MPKTRDSRGSPKEQGIITPILAACLAMGLAFLALSVDLGQLFVAKNELQNIADAAALAGAKKLIQAKDPNNPGSAAVYCTDAVSSAQSVAADNKSLGTVMTVSSADVTMGKWDLVNGVFTTTGCSSDPMQVNAIQVTVSRDGNENPSLTSFFGGLLGSPQMNSSATAVAYLGVAGTSTLDIPFAVSSQTASGAFPGLTRNRGDEGTYARYNPVLDWFMPRQAIASGTTTYHWKDLGGSSLDTTKASLVLPIANKNDSDLFGDLQKYIKGPKTSGGAQFPQVPVGQALYPVSEWEWQSNILSNFQALQTRFTSSKSSATGKWRVTAAVYYTNNPLSAAPTVNRWLGLAQSLLGPKPAYACYSYPTPVVYTQGFVTIDITGVTVGPTSGSNSCTNFSDNTNSKSCTQTCSLDFEVPLTQNTMSTDTSSTIVPKERNYHDINSGAGSVGNFASVPFLVK